MFDLEPTLDKGAQILFVGGVSWIFGSLMGFLGLMNGWLAFLTFWVVGSFLSMVFTIQLLDCKKKAVVITGCDSGFGHRLALHLEELGFRVFACCLKAENGEGAATLREKGSKKLHVLQMDVTSEEGVKDCRETVEKLLPKDECLWGLVNNAGVGTIGFMDTVPMETYKNVVDVNVFGMVNVSQQFLPLIRRAKGRVINVSSLYGRCGTTLQSSYAISKYAVEGLTDCLRHEMKPYGVHVIAIEPGNFTRATGILTEEFVVEKGKEMWKSMSEDTKALYGKENVDFQINCMKNFVSSGESDMTPVMFSFEEALTQKYPQARYQPMEISYKLRIFISTHLPEWFYDMIYILSPEK